MAVNTTNIKFNLMYDSNANSGGRLNFIYTSTSGGTVFSSNLAGTAAFDYFSDTPSVNDAVYFGFLTGGNAAPYLTKWKDIQLQVGTALNGSPTLVWEYYNGTSWSTLTVTNSTAMQSTGTQLVTFTMPTDWISLNPVNGGGSTDGSAGLFIRCRMSATTSVTEGGANATNTPKFGNGALSITGNTGGTAITPEDMYDTAVDQGWDCNPQEFTTGSWKAYGFDCNIEVGTQSYSSEGSTTGYLDFSDQTVILGNDFRLEADNNSNIITAGNEATGGGMGYHGPALYTNQTFHNRCLTYVRGRMNLYGFKYENKYLGAIPTPSQAGSCREITQFGYGNSSADGSEIVNCTFTGFRYISPAVSTSDGRIQYVNIAGSSGGGIYTGATISDVGFQQVDDGVRAILLNSSSDEKNFENIIFNDVQRAAISIYNNAGTIRLRNFIGMDDFTTSNVALWYGISTGVVYHQYSIDVRVQDESGSPISGATVAMTPNGTSEDENNFSVTTDANGDIVRQYVTKEKATYVSTTTVSVTNYDDFTITVSATGYEDTVITFTHDQARELIIGLSKKKGVSSLDLTNDLISL